MREFIDIFEEQMQKLEDKCTSEYEAYIEICFVLTQLMLTFKKDTFVADAKLFLELFSKSKIIREVTTVLLDIRAEYDDLQNSLSAHIENNKNLIDTMNRENDKFANKVASLNHENTLLKFELEAAYSKLTETEEMLKQAKEESSEYQKLVFKSQQEIGDLKKRLNDSMILPPHFVQQQIMNSSTQGRKLVKQAKLITSTHQTNQSFSAQASPMRNHIISVDRSLMNQLNISNANLKAQDSTQQKAHTTDSDKITKKKNVCISKEDVCVYFDSVQPKGITKNGWIVLKDLFVNAHKAPNAHSYSLTTKELAFVLNNKSAQAYNTLRSYLPFPVYNTIKNTFIKEEIRQEKAMLDYTSIPKFLKEFKTIHFPDRDTIRATLAVDAISITNVYLPEYKKSIGSVSTALDKQIAFTKDNISIEQREEFESALRAGSSSNEAALANINSVFIFYLEPHDPTIPCTPVHIYLKHGGNANEVVRKLVDKVAEEITQTNFITISNISTDGDMGHQMMYDRTFQELLEIDPNLDIETIIQSGKFFKLKCVSAADLLHIFKVLRSRCLRLSLNVLPDSEEIICAPERLTALFNEGKELYDLSPVGKMRDSYALLFFSFANLANLIAAEAYNELLVILPFVCFLNAVTNSALKISTVIKLLEISYEFIIKLLNILTIPHEQWKSTEQNNKKHSKYVTVLPTATLKRIVPTLVSLIINLKYYVKININKETDGIDPSVVLMFHAMIDFGIERLGTHPEENFNGFLRDESNDQDSALNILRIIARATMTKQILTMHDVKTAKRDRANTGGLKISEYIGVIPDLPDSIQPKAFVDTLFIIAGAIHPKANLDMNNFNPQMFIDFNSWLQEALPWSKIGKYQRIKCYTANATANSKIDSRNKSNN